MTGSTMGHRFDRRAHLGEVVWLVDTVLQGRFCRGAIKSRFPRAAFEGVLVDVKRFDFGFQGGRLQSEFDRGA